MRWINPMMQRQQGYLTLITVVLIVIVGFISVTLAYITYGSAFATTNLQLSIRALYLADSGLEDGTHELLASTLSNRSTCSGLSLTNASIGSGGYTVTATGPFSASTPTSLNGVLDATATTIPVVSTANYQSSGRIMIDKELINYSSTDATNFLGVTRGLDGSTAASHALGTRIGQYQCKLSSQGGVPSVTPPDVNIGGKRVLTESIQLQEGWAVGNLLSANWNVVHWNRPAEKQWTLQVPAIATPRQLNAVSVISNVDAWAVGTNGTALHFDGSTWTRLTTGIAGGDTLLGVSAVSSTEAWACVSQGHVYRWNGASWTSASGVSGTLNDISMLDTNGNGVADIGWVVGNNNVAYLYNGTTWTLTRTGISANLNGVSTLSSTDAWAAGSTGEIYHWTGGASWALVATPSTTPTLNSISMIKSGASDIGWAVGTGSTAWFYNGTSWASSNTGLAGGLTINSVFTVSAREAWLCASNGSIYEWDGSTWTLVSTSGAGLTNIAILHPNNKPWSAWTENFG